MKQVLILLLSFFYLTGYSQELTYAYKADWSSTGDLKDAKYFMNVIKEDSLYVCRYYNIYGPMIRMESYSDEKRRRPMGRFAWYNEKGKLDSTGILYEGKKDDIWHYYTHPDSSSATVMEEYDKGKFQWRMDMINKTTSYSDGRVETFDTSAVTDSSKTFTSVQVEASFPKGINGWKRYLERNLRTPGRFEQMVKGNGRATVGVVFTVDKEGMISDVYLFRSAEWSVDKEAQRVIKTGPRWEPAMQNGRKVKYRQRQSITFVVQG